LRARINDAPRQVWSPADFADFGGRAAVDKALQRMVASGQLRRIQRGLYDKPSQNALTSKTTVPDYRAVIDAIVRRDQVRWLIDGMTAANICTGFMTSCRATKNRRLFKAQCVAC
jgi:uncharacterized protein DUF6088